MKVSAIVVSRMNDPADFGLVLTSICRHVDELIVVRGEDGVWARYEAMKRAKSKVIYTQDDDAVVDVAKVLQAYEPGVVTCNMPQDRRAEYQDGIALVGWGSVFDRQLASLAFEYYRARAGFVDDEIFESECDRVFTGLSKLKLIEVDFVHTAAAHGGDRMGRRKLHGEYMREIRRRIYATREYFPVVVA